MTIGIVVGCQLPDRSLWSRLRTSCNAFAEPRPQGAASILIVERSGARALFFGQQAADLDVELVFGFAEEFAAAGAGEAGMDAANSETRRTLYLTS